jgi:xanthine dehydrogenase accessory factor
MRKLTELIVLVRGGNEVGSAIAYKLFRSHFRVCITETASPLDIARGVCFSEAVYDTAKEIEGITAERSITSLEQIYKIWRNNNIPVLIDPELSVKPLLKPDVLINAMLLNRQTNTQMTDAPLVIGVGSGFTIGGDVHLVVKADIKHHPGKIQIEDESEQKPNEAYINEADIMENRPAENIILAEDAGVFTTEKNIGDEVNVGDVIGKLNELSITAPVSGILCGLLRNEVKVLAKSRLAEVASKNNKADCFAFSSESRAIAGGALEAVMMSLNVEGLS